MFITVEPHPPIELAAVHEVADEAGIAFCIEHFVSYS